MVLARPGRVDVVEVNVRVADDVRLERDSSVGRDLPRDDRVRVVDEPPAHERRRDREPLPRRRRRDRRPVERLDAEVDAAEQRVAGSDVSISEITGAPKSANGVMPPRRSGFQYVPCAPGVGVRSATWT
jgi:hypothetical protein